MELAGSPTGALPVNLWGPLSALACMNNPLARQPAVTRAGGQRGTAGGDLASFGSPPAQTPPEGDVSQPPLTVAQDALLVQDCYRSGHSWP